jgi:hypothetical protein
MASGALCAQGLRAPSVLSSGIALRGEPVLSSKSVSTGVSLPALRIQAATKSYENPTTGGGTKSVRKVCVMLLLKLASF